MIIELPVRLNRESMTELLNQVISESGEPLHQEYTFNFHTCYKFIEPIGVTFLHNLLTWLKARNIVYKFDYPSDELTLSNIKHPVRYLDDCGFFENHIGKKLYQHSHLRSTTVKLQDVSIHNFITWLPNHLMNWVANSINKDSEELDTFKTCLEEIFNNVRDHAGVDVGCVFAQHIPQQNHIKISVADIGIGIINRIKSEEEYKGFTDREALVNSVKRDFTTKSSPKNRGMGLDNLIYNIVLNAKGVVYIYANKGILKAYEVNNEIVYEYQDASHYYPGTYIEVEFYVSQANDLFDIAKEEFSWG